MMVEATDTVTIFPADVDGGGKAVWRDGVYEQPWEAKRSALERGGDGASSGGGGGQGRDLPPALDSDAHGRPRVAATSTGVPGRKQRGASERVERGASREPEREGDGGLRRRPPSPEARRCRARARGAGRGGAPLLWGGELVVQAGSGGEGVWEEESCSVLYRAARCTVDTVRRGESWWAAAAGWARWAAGNVSAWRCRRLDASVHRPLPGGRDTRAAVSPARRSTEKPGM
jgi:hypothetical protein